MLPFSTIGIGRGDTNGGLDSLSRTKGKGYFFLNGSPSLWVGCWNVFIFDQSLSQINL